MHSTRIKIIIASALTAITVSAFCFVVFPSQAYALTITPIHRVLETADNIEQVWTSVRNIVNVIIIAALIFIAFANILRINLNNYAIKKFLPALIFGVIAANFSYFICRFMIDMANVAMNLLIEGATAGEHVGPDKIGVAGAFDFTMIKIDPNNLWKTFIYVLAEFAGAVVIFILAFLFIIRNYVIMFMVVLSPLAFMATVLPETKSFFKSWTSWFMKWTFMPIVSLFWLWVGGMWYSSGLGVAPPEAGGDFNAYMVALVFAIVCYYLAITTPFKMGGAVMSGWANWSKKGLGLVGTVTGTRALWNYNKDKASTLWKSRGLEFQRRVKDVTGIGKGLDQAKKRLELAEEDRKLVSEEGKAAYVKRNARNLALRQVRNDNRSTSDFAMKIARQGLIQDAEEYATEGMPRLQLFGKKFFRKKNDRLLRRVEKARFDLQRGMMEGEAADDTWGGFDSRQKKRLLSRDKEGRLVDAHGNPIVARERGRFEPERLYQRRARRAEKQVDERLKFEKEWAHYNWFKQKETSEANKLAEKLWNNVALERFTVSQSKKMLDVEEKNLDALRSINRLLEAEGRGEEIDRGMLEQNMGMLMGLGHSQTDLNDPAYRTQLMTTLESSYTRALESFQNRTASYTGDQEIPLHLKDLVSKNPDGSVEVEPMSSQEFKRSAKIIESDIVSGGVERYMNTNTPHEMANSILYENSSIIEHRILDAALSGNYGSLTPDEVESAAEYRHAYSRMMATERGAEIMAPALLEKSTKLDNKAGLAEVARNVNDRLDRMIAGANTEDTQRALRAYKINHRSSDSEEIASGLNKLLHVSDGNGIARPQAISMIRTTQDAIRSLVEKGGSLGTMQ